MVPVLIDDLCDLKVLTDDQVSALMACFQVDVSDKGAELEKIISNWGCGDPECTECESPDKDALIQTLVSLESLGMCHYDRDLARMHFTSKGARMIHLVMYLRFVKDAGLRNVMEKVSEIMEATGDIQPVKRTVH